MVIPCPGNGVHGTPGIARQPYLLLDAGGTLVFPDQGFLIEQAGWLGISLTPAQLLDGYCRLIYHLDSQVRASGYLPSRPWPNGYVHALLELLGLTGPAGEAIKQASQVRHREKSLWAFTFDWVPETLARLVKQGYRMSIISNSDGRTEELLDQTGLLGYFERVFDSHLLGLEKPHPAIFETALTELNVPPAEALYVGDVFYIDVVGANRAGLGCIHLDPAGLYRNWPGVHLPDIRHLPDWLAHYAANPAAFDLFPGRHGKDIAQDDGQDSAFHR